MSENPPVNYQNLPPLVKEKFKLFPNIFLIISKLIEGQRNGIRKMDTDFKYLFQPVESFTNGGFAAS